MRFGRKSKADASRGGTRGQATPKRQNMTNPELGPNTGADGLPGRAGYPNGPRTELPTFFATRRPDGKPDPVVRKKKLFG